MADGRRYLAVVVSVGACSLVAALMAPYFERANLIMVYLFGVVLVAGRFGRGPSILAAVLSVAAFDFLFVPPALTFRVSDTEYVVTLAVMLLVAILISTLTVRSREVEGERLRTAILAAVSHDLRTPLASIAGAASSLAASPDRLDPEARRELVLTIHEEAQRMSRLANNLLEMGRLQSHAIVLNREWQPLEDVIGSALNHLEASIGDRDIRVLVPEDLPLVPIDDVLIERVLVNLLENALRYAPGSPIAIEAHASAQEVTVEVLDRGPGFRPGEREHVFEKFYRGDAARGRHGVGLGLAVTRAIVQAHGGRIEARNREGGGAALRFTLPRQGRPPAGAASAP